MTQLVQDGLVVQDGLAITLPHVYTTYQTPAAPKTQARSSGLTAHRDGRDVWCPFLRCLCCRRQAARSGTGQATAVVRYPPALWPPTVTCCSPVISCHYRR